MIGFTTDKNNQQYARPKMECGNKSIVDLYPEYGFMLAVPCFKKRMCIFKYMAILGFILSPSPLLFCFMGMGMGVEVFVPCISILIGSVLFLGYYWRFKKFLAKSPKIVYIQKYGLMGYSFIVDENRHWGMVDNKLTILIPTDYDVLKWRKDQLIDASLGSNHMVIDIHNNVCI